MPDLMASHIASPKIPTHVLTGKVVLTTQRFLWLINCFFLGRKYAIISPSVV